MSQQPRVWFDESLPVFVTAIAETLGKDTLEHGLIVRDTSGRLRFVCARKSPASSERDSLQRRAGQRLGSYARAEALFGFEEDPGVSSLLADPSAFYLNLNHYRVRMLDRRIVGSAWTEFPREISTKPPRLAFASLKGGVGRSTALALTAADLARRNRNVLIFDLDLEAPGVGGMLLDRDRMPRFGAIDFLVENGLSPVREKELADFVGTSNLTSPGGGRVDVVPAIALSSLLNPANVLGKLSRAMIEDFDENGESISVPSKMAEMVDRFTARDHYDVVLVDSRAGLSELAAPAILGLGATVLLFGTAQRQTFEGYAPLFAALQLLAQRARESGSRADWRLLFKAVLAKASSQAGARDWYRDEMYEIFAENLYDEENPQHVDPEAITFPIDDPEAPHWPLIIPFDPGFVDFDPVRVPSQLSAPFYEAAFRPFLNSIDSIIAQGGLLSD
jgi:cellulose biosynthesis protein BcsQ